MISTGLYCCRATFCHNRQGYSATFLSVVFVTVMMVLVSAFDTDPQNLMRDERYDITLLRGAIEELIKVCSLLLFAAVPLSDKGKLATSLGNPIWILAILIASYENILLWAEPVATSVQVLLVTDGSAPDQFPAVMYYGSGGLFGLAVMGVVRVFVHFYLTALALIYWQRQKYFLFSVMLAAHGIINVIALSVAVYSSSPQNYALFSTLLFMAVASLLYLHGKSVMSRQSLPFAAAFDDNPDTTKNCK